jgi:hypothetical protein
VIQSRRRLGSLLATLLAYASILLALMIGLMSYPVHRVNLFKKRRVVFGTTPILNNKYWAEALRQSGYDALSVVSDPYVINSSSDFDVVFGRGIRAMLSGAVYFHQLLWTAETFVTSFDGYFWFAPKAYRLALLYRLYRVRTIIIPYGSDAWTYRRHHSPMIAHVLMSDYPQAGKRQRFLAGRVDYWVDNCDAIIPAHMGFQGIGRWSVLVPSTLCIPASSVSDRKSSSTRADKRVRIMHAPNHQMIKGTEVVLDVVHRLQSEGYEIEFRLMEKISNKEVLHELVQTDILIPQINGGYGLAAVEGMAHGTVVMADLEELYPARIFDRYSFLSECPIVSTTWERLYTDLKALLDDESLRMELAALGPQYVERYHSYAFFANLFEVAVASITRPSSHLTNYYHPLTGLGRPECPLLPPLDQHRISTS